MQVKKPKPGQPPKASGDTVVNAQQSSIKPMPADDDRKPTASGLCPTMGRGSAIVTAREPGKTARVPAGWWPDTPEEHKRRGDAADALCREMVRRIAVMKDRP